MQIGKNAGAAVLYESVKSIINLGLAGGLRILASNTLGKFLINKDVGYKCIALKSMK